MSKRWAVGAVVAALLGGSLAYAASSNEPAISDPKDMPVRQGAKQQGTEIIQSHCGGGGGYGHGGGGGWGHGGGHYGH